MRFLNDGFFSWLVSGWLVQLLNWIGSTYRLMASNAIHMGKIPGKENVTGNRGDGRRSGAGQFDQCGLTNN